MGGAGLSAEVVARTEGERTARLDRLLRRASVASRLDERLMLGVGAVLVAAGLASVVVGYVGASHTVLVAGQIPYLISGGLLGVALVVLGGLVYFGYWLALLVRETRAERMAAQAERQQLRAVLLELSRALEETGRTGRRARGSSRES
jgi:hypothetical protein